MRIDRYFEEAEKLGIKPFEVSFLKRREVSVDTFNDRIEDQQIGETSTLGGKGIFHGRLGSFSSDAISSDSPKILAEKVKESAEFGKKYKAEYFCPGGLKYRKVKASQSEFRESDLRKIREACLDLYPKIKNRDPRIESVQLSISMFQLSFRKANSLGLDVSKKNAIYQFYIVVNGVDQNQDRRSGEGKTSSVVSLEDLLKKAETAIDDAIKGALDFFGSKPVKSGNYPVIFNPSCFSVLLGVFLSQFNAKDIQKKTSNFVGMKNRLVASRALTIENVPHKVSPGCSAFDAEGYPTKEFTIIQNGVLKDYFYSIETARKARRDSNGCACGGGNGSYQLISVESEKKNFSDLLLEMKDGLYITDISGLNSGLDPQTLDFSLPCVGYLVKDGKIQKAVSMIAIAGNLKDVFRNLTSLADDVRLRSGMYLPSVLISEIMVSGS